MRTRWGTLTGIAHRTFLFGLTDNPFLVAPPINPRALPCSHTCEAWRNPGRHPGTPLSFSSPPSLEATKKRKPPIVRTLMPKYLNRRYVPEVVIPNSRHTSPTCSMLGLFGSFTKNRQSRATLDCQLPGPYIGLWSKPAMLTAQGPKAIRVQVW